MPSFWAEEGIKFAGRFRLMTKYELKRALSAKLRDPLTSARSFVSMLSIYVKLNPGWKLPDRRLQQWKRRTHCYRALDQTEGSEIGCEGISLLQCRHLGIETLDERS
jgi:hypothetical protein